MKDITEKFYRKYAESQTVTVRNIINNIHWSDRLIGIKGSRGVGKTTLVMQHIIKNYPPDNSVLYVSLDDLFFTDNRLYNLADEFHKKGGKLLALDEVHRYPDWASEIKNIYDDFPKLKVIFTGSSLLQLSKAKADLSRRAVIYKMPGLSFREFLKFETKKDLPIYTLEEIVNNHIDISIKIIKELKPLQYFENYLNYGYFPFYLENKASFDKKLSEVILTILEVDIPQFEQIQTSHIIYIKRLLKIISNSAPFKPNIDSLSQRTGISVNTVKSYLKILNDADLIKLLHFEEKGINSMNKPDKIYLENTNLMFNLVGDMADTGNLRETFFYNQVNFGSKVFSSKQADFNVNDTYTFEIGGKNKSKKQISGVPHSYIVKDNIEIGHDNVIPLWLFGFLY